MYDRAAFLNKRVTVDFNRVFWIGEFIEIVQNLKKYL